MPWRIALLALACWASGAPLLVAAKPASGVVRVATYNVSMYRDRAGELLEELEAGRSRQARHIAEVLQRVRPHVVLLNEFDFYDDQPSRTKKRLPTVFIKKYLNQSQRGLDPIDYPQISYSSVNTGVDSGMDLDRDGKLGGPADAWGYGRYPGQYGMLVLSQFPIAQDQRATFTNLRWNDLPNPTWPRDPKTATQYYDARTRDALRLPSKSFWHEVIKLPGGSSAKKLHLLCSHPTPPVFDGPEDRNGCRNFDEIRMIAHYISERGKRPFRADSGEQSHGLPADAKFVVLGDLNADPHDGGGRPGAIAQLLEHPAINARHIPTSQGAVAASAALPDLNRSHRGNPAHDTANFGGDGYGNLRVDYALPSKGLKIAGAGVFWPQPGQPGAEAITASDHRLVWIDIQLAENR